MSRRLFCEISPRCYQISVAKGCLLRRLQDVVQRKRFAHTKSAALLPVVVYRHNSLIRRRLGKVDMALQENKAVNLALTAPKISGVLIRPGEEFSFWRLAGRCSAKEGYREGMTISLGEVGRGIGGGMCQFTNLLHWMVLHSPLTITEHHHHDGMDLFPDYGRQIPFGTGTSIFYNYRDYRVKNNTDTTFQLITRVEGEYLCGELRADKPLAQRWHIKSENEHFFREPDGVYRNGSVVRECVDARTGNLVSREVIKHNHARVLYDTAGLVVEEPV